MQDIEKRRTGSFHPTRREGCFSVGRDDLGPPDRIYLTGIDQLEVWLTLSSPVAVFTV